MDMLDQALESSQDKDGDSSHDDAGLGDKEVLAAQNLTIVEEDGSLGSAGDLTSGDVGEDQAAVAGLSHAQGLLDASGNVQYQFRTDSGQAVTYRVVQVASPGDSTEVLPQIVSSSSGFSSPSPQGVQAVLTSPINGQFYVIGSPQDVFGTPSQRSLAPRAGQLESRGSSCHLPLQRDERRRATHNEVERRRRDKINHWIVKLSKIIPECAPDHAKQGQVSFEGQSKGGILAKACEYIMELRNSNQRLGECIKENERLTMDVEMLRQQGEELRRENILLRAHLEQNGILPPESVELTTS
ncbi:upstream stimulatory factor 1 isoform X2 [Ischnura elegans]|uniref:upstream stimulatory factor 1 isoform X2 n=1 Tax=Ischnura elegans TaxID=197161 RepID=UPI001ED8945D|nr:upstream stimulatory factor 1 isoform X2 [Ischnura elegans]